MHNHSTRAASLRCSVATALVVGALSAVSLPAFAGGPLTTVTWTPSGTVSSTGTGTLEGGAVAYFTDPVRNAGETLTDDFDTSAATSTAVGTGVTDTSAGVLGASPASSADTITFSDTVFHPVMLVNYTDGPDSIDFGSLPFVLLDANNAQKNGGTVTFNGSTNSDNDGFAIQFLRDFGPTDPLTFDYVSGNPGGNSVAFTIGLTGATAPEPGSIALLTAGVPLLGAIIRRRKKS